MRILLTNGNSRMSLCIARCLKAVGHQVIVSDYIKNSMCFFSRKKDQYFIYPSPYSHPEHFIDTIYRKVKEFGIDVLLPVHEETFLISKNQDEILKYVSIAVPKYHSLLSVHNKDKLYDLLKRYSIKTPITLFLENFDNFNDIKYFFPGKIVLKPRQGGGNWGLFFPDPNQCYEKQLRKYIEALNIDIARVLVQEWIPTDKKYSHVVVYQNNSLVQDFADVHLRDFPLSGGAGVLRESCDPRAMTDISKHLFDAIGWHGVAEVEYVSHAETGEIYLIEVNPRVWGGINSAIASQLNIPEMYIDIASNRKVSPKKYVTGVRTRWFWGDMRVFPEYYHKSNSKISAVAEYACLPFGNTITDEFYWDDPLPFFAWPMHAIYKIFKSRGLTPVAYDSLSGEWK